MENKVLTQRLDDFGQVGRLGNLRIFQLEETPQENLTTEVATTTESRLGIKVSNDDIISCTRVGKMLQSRTRGVLLKLSSPSLKQAICNIKKLLKGSGIVIKKDLTENKRKLVEAEVEKTSLKSVWTYNGRVCELKNNKRVFMNDTDDPIKIDMSLDLTTLDTWV
nr:unnamed protein product [Callosobruchus analis]